MSENESAPSVACALTDRQNEQRPEEVHSVLAANYEGFEEHEKGYTILFDGTDRSLSALATFVANELQCCSFTEYSIAVSPPYERTRLTVTGPEGTKSVFSDGLLDRLESGIL
jgi:hypothetical protein